MRAIVFFNRNQLFWFLFFFIRRTFHSNKIVVGDLHSCFLCCVYERLKIKIRKIHMNCAQPLTRAQPTLLRLFHCVICAIQQCIDV